MLKLKQALIINIKNRTYFSHNLNMLYICDIFSLVHFTIRIDSVNSIDFYRILPYYKPGARVRKTVVAVVVAGTVSSILNGSFSYKPN